MILGRVDVHRYAGRMMKRFLHVRGLHTAVALVTAITLKRTRSVKIFVDEKIKLHSNFYNLYLCKYISFILQ